MPRKPKSEKAAAEVLAPIPAEILDQLVRDGPLTAEEIETASRRFTKALMERALGGELTYHLGDPPGAAKPDLATNHRNGTSGKRVLTDEGPPSRTRRMLRRRMDAAGPADAENAPTGPWKTAQNAVSHSVHTHHRHRLTHKKPDTPHDLRRVK